MKVVIVGGVAGGASAAARIRRLDEHAQIIMIERSGYVSYANCGLPYYVGGVIKEQEELTLQTPESFWDRFRIDVRVRQEVTAIDPTEKTVTVHALDSGKVYTETYDKLLLAPGAKPTVPALSGVSSERVFTLRTVEDTLRIRHFVEDQKPKNAVLAGGGFIGLEMAENLTEMGVSVTIVQRPNQLLAPLDADMASFVHAEMRRHGVTLRLGETVTGFRQDGDSVLTLLEGSEPLHSDMVLLAIGVTPDNTRAADSAERLSLRNGETMSENLFGLTVAADKGLDDLQCQRLLSENRRYQEVMLQYRCALKALESRLEILNEEFSLQHDRNPIESMKSRLKSPSSIMNKMQKRGLSLDFPTMQANIMDIAGVRVICSFEEDVFFLAKCLKDQSDIEIITEKDYISHPKPNGYRSLHLTIRLPVFFAEKEIHVPVEIQLRTIAMDFWASLEHTIRYKKNLPINAEVETELKECANSSREWDSKMEHLLHILT